MEKALGLSPADIERVVVVFPDANVQAPKVWALIATRKAYDPAKLLSAGGAPLQKKEHNGKPYYEQNGGPQAPGLHFINDHLMLGGTVEGVKDYLGRTAKPKTDGPLSGAVALAGQKHHLVVGFNVPPGLRQQFGPLAPPQNVVVFAGDNEGSVTVKWEPVRGAMSYQLEHTTDPNVPSSWVNHTNTTRSEALYTGLASGTRMWFRVRGLGAAGEGAWSDPSVKTVP